MDARWHPALVTGGTGFVGANLVRRLARDGVPVHALVRNPAAGWRLAGLSAGVTLHPCDLEDRDAVRAAVQAARPRVVFHLATVAARHRTAGAAELVSGIVQGTGHLFEAAADAGAALFVNVGSSSEYGIKAQPMRETDLLAPVTPYGVAKAAQTHLVAALSRARGLDAVTLRPFSVYGPWEGPDRLIPSAIRSALAGVPLKLGSPDPAHDFLHVDDLVDLLLRVDRFTGRRGDIFNAATGVQTTNRAVLDLVLRVLGRTIPLEWGAFPPHPGDSTTWVADLARVTAELGWTPRIALAEGLAGTAGWMAQQPDPYGPALAAGGR